MRLIDADRLLKFKTDHEMISTHIIWNAPTVEAIPIEWLEDIIEDWKDEARKIDEARKKMTAKSMPSDSIEALARIVALQGERIDALEEEAIPIAWLKDQAKDTTNQHRVDGLIERWRREHD